MGRLWNEELAKLDEDYRHTTKAWELLHEEEGFEDTGWTADPMLTDLDGQETHMPFWAESVRKAMMER